MPEALELPDAPSTQRFGVQLARALPDLTSVGMVVHLRGELGAGKTALVRALLHALGHVGTVRSPSYTLVEPYVIGATTIAHVDLYRIRHPDELDELGLRDYLGPHHLLLIEWPEHGGARVPAPDLLIHLHYHGNARRAVLSAHSAPGRHMISTLAC